jgi:hypothetical protein
MRIVQSFAEQDVITALRTSLSAMSGEVTDEAMTGDKE